MGASNAYLIPKSSPFVASNIAPVYTKAEAIPAITTSTSDDVVSLNKITEYANIGNGMNSKNKTPIELATASFAFWR